MLYLIFVRLTGWMALLARSAAAAEPQTEAGLGRPYWTASRQRTGRSDEPARCPIVASPAQWTSCGRTTGSGLQCDDVDAAARRPAHPGQLSRASASRTITAGIP